MNSAGDEGGQPAQGLDLTRSMELVRQGQRGDAGAVNELLTRYIPRLRRILAVKIAPAQRAAIDPDDVLQETLIVATQRLGGFEAHSAGSLLHWLAKIADNQIKSRLEYLHAEKRDAGRERRLGAEADSTAGPGIAVPSTDPSPSQVYAREELEKLVDRELQQLEPPDYRDVILLRDYCESEWEHIRTVLRRPTLGAVQDLYHRAHARLRERLARFVS